MTDLVCGFLALLSGSGVTEIAAASYSRQPITFGRAVNGVSHSVTSFDFGQVGAPPIVARAIYDAPTGGNQLLLMPHATPRLPAGGSTDRGEAGYLTLVVNALAAYPDSGGYNGTFAAGTVIGTCYDRDDIVSTVSTMPNVSSGLVVYPSLGQFTVVAASPLSTGSGLTVLRGLLHA